MHTPHKQCTPRCNQQEAFRSAAIPTLAARLQQRHERQRAASEQRLRGVQEVQQSLASRRQQLEQATAACAAERDALERTLQELAVRSVELDSWLDEYGKKQVGGVWKDVACFSCASPSVCLCLCIAVRLYASLCCCAMCVCLPVFSTLLDFYVFSTFTAPPAEPSRLPPRSRQRDCACGRPQQPRAGGPRCRPGH